MSKSPRVGSLWLALSLVTFLFSGCGDSFQTVETGEATCSGRSGICELGFSNINFRRNDNEAVVTIGNTGGGPLEIRSLSLSEDASPYLRFTDVTIRNVSTLANWVPTDGDRSFDGSAGPVLVEPRDNFEIRVLLSPVDGETRCPGGEVGSSIDCGSIIVVTNDGNNSTITIPIEVSAGSSRIEVSPNPLSFSPQQLIDENGGRYASQERELTISNAGATNLTISSIESSDDFVTVADVNGVSTFPVIVPPGAASVFVLTWTPVDEDPLSAQLTIVSDAVNANASGRTTVLLDSAGQSQPAIEIDPCAFVFPTDEVGTPSQQNFEVRNTGTAALTWSVTLIGFTPTDARQEFVVLNEDGVPVSGNQPSLDPFEVASLTLQHTSTDDRSVSGEMRIAGNFGTPRVCTFSGGPPEARIDLSPSEIWSSEVDEGESLVRTVAVRNAGQAVLDVTRIERGAGVTGEYSLNPLDEGGFSLEPGEGRRMEITYLRREDDQPANDQLTLILTHNDQSVSNSSTVRFTVRHDDELERPLCSVTRSSEGAVAVGDTIVFDATGTTFPSGNPSPNPYRWNLLPPLGSAAVITDAFSSTQSITFDVAGTYDLGMVASAVFGASELTQCEELLEVVVE